VSDGPRVLIACVGNLLRRDDGFGPAIAARLEEVGLPEGVRVVETGIGGVALLQELMTGYDGLVLIDAVDRGERPGTVFVITPQVGAAAHVPDLHLANPERVLTMATAMRALPERVRIVGCQPANVDELDERLSPEVERSLELATERIEETVREWS
jgi:hydrogenase maturation protease